MLKGLYLVLFTDDNIEAKKELAKGICEDFVNFYNENDFKQLSRRITREIKQFFAY